MNGARLLRFVARPVLPTYAIRILVDVSLLRRHSRTELGKNLHSCSLARSDIYFDMLDETPQRSNSASSAHEMKKRDCKEALTQLLRVLRAVAARRRTITPDRCACGISK